MILLYVQHMCVEFKNSRDCFQPMSCDLFISSACHFTLLASETLFRIPKRQCFERQIHLAFLDVNSGHTVNGDIYGDLSRILGRLTMTIKRIRVQAVDYKPKSKQQDHTKQLALSSRQQAFDCLAFDLSPYHVVDFAV